LTIAIILELFFIAGNYKHFTRKGVEVMSEIYPVMSGVPLVLHVEQRPKVMNLKKYIFAIQGI